MSKNFYVRKFQRKTAVKLLIFYNDRRVRTFYRVPSEGLITLEGKTFAITKEDYSISKGFPTYVFNENNTAPVNVLRGKETKGYTPEEMNIAINNNVARQIFLASEKRIDASLICIMLQVVSVALVGYLLYTMSAFTTDVIERLNDIRETLRVIGGR